MARPEGRFGRIEWVLSRPCYRFGAFELGHIPKAKRPQALKLQLTQWSPFPQAEYYIAWRKDTALVWAWDAERTRGAIAEAGLEARRVSVVPETVLYPAAESGVRVQKCIEGFEAQVWQGGSLRQSRWWPKAPGVEDWLSFQRDASIPPEGQLAEPPPVLEPAMLARPWAESAGLQGQASAALENERLLVALGAILLSAATLWYGIDLAKLAYAYGTRGQELAKLRREAGPVLGARREALQDLARITELRRELDPYPDQLFLMARVAAILPHNDAHLEDWDFHDGKLRLSVAASSPLSSTFLVNALQTAGPFSNVKALAGGDPKSVALQMDVGGS